VGELSLSDFQDTALFSTVQSTSVNMPSDPVDPVAAVTHPAPYAYYRRLAQQPVLTRDARLPLWIAAHPELIAAVMGHPDCLVRPVHEPVPAAITCGSGAAGAVFGELARMNDGERHAQRRAIVDAILASIDTGAAAQRARDVAALLLRDGVADAGRLNAFVLQAPVCTMASLLGFTDADLPRIALWTSQFVACLSPLSGAEQIAAAHTAAQSLLADLRSLPGASAINDDARMANLLGLLSQTCEATAGLLGNCIVALLRGAAAAPLEQLVQATLRDDPPIHNTRRFAARDLGINGVTVRQGETILLILAAQAGEHGFGLGRHRCPGSRLAAIIAEQALTTLLARHTLPPVSWHYRPSVNARLPQFVEALS
jgi:cytochrome P450